MKNRADKGKLRIISDGSSEGTYIYDDNGKEMLYMTNIQINMSFDKDEVSTVIEVINVESDIQIDIDKVQIKQKKIKDESSK